MKIKLLLAALFLFLSFSASNATGLLMPVKAGYPKDFLRLKSTEVTVNIHGIVAETVVLQSFENEWDDSTDAVYSFPLPNDARATEFVYWYNDKPYRAVLKVGEQSTNPGTGEGGTAALVNSYIGRNGIKIYLRGIRAHSIQTVRLHYVSRMDYFEGKSTYTFPLNTSDFVPYPLDYAKFNINLNSGTPVTKYDVPGFTTDIKASQPSDKELGIEILKSKFYLDNDFSFSYETDISKLGVDFYSIGAKDTTGGHFALFVRPQNKALADSILKKCIVFLLSKNSNMYGTNLDASKSAISKSLDLLGPKDYFNIVAFDYNVNAWKSSPVEATADNISGAKTYLSSISTSGGSNLQEALKQCLIQFNDSAFVNNTFNRSVLIFTESGSNLDPVQIETLNTKKAGIFPIGLGDNLSRARLEMTAALNYGFVTYIAPGDNAEAKMLRLFSQISQPILKDVAFEYGSHAGISSIVPSRFPVTFAGSSFFMAGRYKASGESPLSIAGYSVKGTTAFDFRLPFSADTTNYKFAESIWAKEKIDDLERKIEIYGETPSSKQELIALSLKYNIRCRYTAYIADYKTPATDVKAGKNAIMPQSFIAGNYPNPFNPATKIRLYLSDASRGKVKFVRIYNILGRLVALIEITGLNPGWNEVYFNGRDLSGSTLPSGIYLVRLQIGEEIVSTFRINLIK